MSDPDDRDATTGSARDIGPYSQMTGYRDRMTSFAAGCATHM
jgi:hypothetical protein